MLKGEHMTEEFIKKYPSGEIPVLIDGHKHIYGGGSMTVVKHLCNRFENCATRFCFQDYRKEMDMMDAWLTKNIKPITTKIQKLQILNLLNLQPEFKEIRTTEITKTFYQLETLIFPVLEYKILTDGK